MSDKSKKAKLFITLEKHSDFDANIAKFEQIKQENEANNATTKEWRSSWASKDDWRGGAEPSATHVSI